MQTFRPRVSLLWLIVGGVAVGIGPGWGQTQEVPPPPGRPAPPELPAPAPSPTLTALIAQRRDQLLAEQKRLQESASFYGRNHPSSQAALRQLATVDRQLELWSDAAVLPGASELSELVLRLTIKVDQLERQVAALRRSPGSR